MTGDSGGVNLEDERGSSRVYKIQNRHVDYCEQRSENTNKYTTTKDMDLTVRGGTVD